MHNLVMNQSTISKKYLTNVVKLDKNRKKGIVEVYVDEKIIRKFVFAFILS